MARPHLWRPVRCLGRFPHPRRGGDSFPSQFTRLTGTPTLNRGVGGQTSTQIRTRFFAEPELFGERAIFWVGRNNYFFPDAVKLDIAAMVAALTNDDFVILGVLNGDYNSNETKGALGYNVITGLNADLSAAYGEHFIDIRQILVDSYKTNSIGDIADNVAGLVPRSLRLDGIHLNRDGVAIVARTVADRFTVIVNSQRIELAGGSFNDVTGSFTLRWVSLKGVSYKIEKRASLEQSSWNTVVGAYPIGGAIDSITSFTDSNAGAIGLYRVSFSP